MGIVLFFIIFGVVVIAHEFGHFIIAKANGISVVEFTVGMGPCIFSVKKGGTKYAIRLLPLGGACIFEGEDGIERDTEKKEAESGEADPQQDVQQAVANTELGSKKKPGAFPDAPVFARIATVLAGPVFNFILAFLMSTIIVGSYGTDLPVVQQVSDGGAAQLAGMQDGDRILFMNGKKIHLYREISLASMLNKGEDIAVTYERDGKQYDTVIKPIYDESAGRYYMGLYGVGSYQKFGIFGTVKYSLYEVGYWINTTVKSLELLIQGQVSKDDVSGPVGMAQTVTQIYDQSKPDGIYYIWLNMLNFAILLSANLGVLNLLPFPALDGGKVVFLIIEGVTGHAVPEKLQGTLTIAAFALLFGLMLFATYNDIIRLVTGAM